MNRYITTLQVQDTDTRNRRYQTSFFKQIPVSSGDIYIKTTSIERLDKLAYFFYNDSTYWPVIAAANNIGKGTLMIPVNTNIRIPDPAQVSVVINNILNNE